MKELSLNDIAQVSGGGNSGDRLDRGRTPSTNYGGQADGFQSNKAAGGTGGCGTGTVAGLVGGLAAAGVATGGLAAGIGFVGGLASGMIGGQCFPSGSSSSSRNGPPFR